MYLLSLETSTKNFSLSVSHDGKLLHHHQLMAMHVLEDSIIAAIEDILKASNISLAQVNAFAIGLGPGSFTSLRVGLATIKAFALVGRQRVVGVCSLDIIARSVVGKYCDEICVLIDARRGMVYSGIFDAQGNIKGEYSLSTIEEVLKRVHGQTLFVGDGLVLNRDKIIDAYQKHATAGHGNCQALFVDQDYWFPQAQFLAAIAQERLCSDKTDDPTTLLPLYLYAQDCQVHK